MRYYLGLAMLLILTAAFPQQPPTQQEAPNEVQNYAPYSIALVPAAPGGEVVLPFLTTDNKLAFFPVSQVQQASKEKRLLGRPISYGELIALIGELQIQVNQLKQENEKLWTVVGKSSTPQTVVVQTPPAPAQTARPNNDALVKYLLLRQLFPSPQPIQIEAARPTPYVVPPPVIPNNNIHCTSRRIGNQTYTDCY